MRSKIRICIKVTSRIRKPHKSDKSDPDPHQSEKLDPDPNQNEKRDPNLQNWLKAQFWFIFGLNGNCVNVTVSNSFFM